MCSLSSLKRLLWPRRSPKPRRLSRFQRRLLSRDRPPYSLRERYSRLARTNINR